MSDVGEEEGGGGMSDVGEEQGAAWEDVFSSLLIHNSRSSARRRVNCHEVPSQLTGAPHSNDWREAAGAQGLCCRGRNGAPPKVRGGAAVRCAVRGVPHPPQSRLDCVWGGVRVGTCDAPNASHSGGS